MLDPKLRQSDAAKYLGVSVRAFRRFAIRPDYLPGRGTRKLPVWPVSRLEEFYKAVNEPKSRTPFKAFRRQA